MRTAKYIVGGLLIVAELAAGVAILYIVVDAVVNKLAAVAVIVAVAAARIPVRRWLGPGPWI